MKAAIPEEHKQYLGLLADRLASSGPRHSDDVLRLLHMIYNLGRTSGQAEGLGHAIDIMQSGK